MLRLPGIDALLQVLHAAGDVRRLVGGVIENVVRGYDAQGGEQHRGHGHTAAVATQKPDNPLAGPGAIARRVRRGLRWVALPLPFGPHYLISRISFSLFLAAESIFSM